MSKLVALAVVGDAFLHYRSNGTILVDGGGSSINLAAELVKQSPAVTKIDVVVCTHADLDHANGLKSILTAWKSKARRKVSIGEFWLPGRWTEIAREGLTDPKALMSKLTSDMDSGFLNILRSILSDKDSENQESHYNQSGPSQSGDSHQPDIRILSKSDVLRILTSSSLVVDPLTAPVENDHSGDEEMFEVTSGGLRRIRMPSRIWALANPIQLANARADMGLPRGTDIGERKTNDRTESNDNLGCASEREDSPPFEPDWLRSLRNGDQAVIDRDVSERAFLNARRRVEYRRGEQPHLIRRGRPRRVHASQIMAEYCRLLIDTAEAIAAIARHAIAEKIPIRWFDQDQFSETGKVSGGRTNFLLPMNSVELRSQPIALPTDAVFYLSLSQANRESLVFYSPADANSRGVVFCADSRLGYGYGGHTPFHVYPSMKKSDQIGTAPHHAAESAAGAYVHAPLFGIDHWLCAYNGRTTAGPTFRTIKKGRRCCTACKLKKTLPACVTLDLDITKFTMSTNCDC